MSSPSKPFQVPKKDVLCNLIQEGKGNKKYREIEAYLVSSDYTRETKIEWVLYPRDNSRKSLFHDVCMVSSPMYLIELVVDILGEEQISSPACTTLLCEKTFFVQQPPATYNNKGGRIELLIEKVMENLKNSPEVKTKLLLEAIVNCTSDDSFRTPTDFIFEDAESPPIQSIPISFYNIEIIQSASANTKTDSLKIIKPLSKGGPKFKKNGNEIREFHKATILEIALHKKICSDYIVELIKGKKELVTLSKRSLLEGAMYEYGNESIEILEQMLYYGGRELVMIDRSWWNTNTGKINIFQSLSEHKDRLLEICGKVRYYYRKEQIVKIMGLMLDKGGKDLILKTNEAGQSILHNFAYFGYMEFVPIVRRILEIGGDSLLKIQDEKGNTILHQLSKEISITNEYSEILEEMLEKGGKKLILKTNEAGQSILHTFNYFGYIKFEPIVRRILEIGGDSLLKIQDEKGNTILHHRLQQECCRKTQAEIIGLMLDKGGKKLILKTNEAGQSILHTFNYFKYMEFVPIVRRILEIGGDSLLKIQDEKGNSILHHLLQQYFPSRDHYETQVEIIGLMLDKGGKDLVLRTNEAGQSILHNFAYFEREEFQPILGRILEIGGDSLLKIQDEKGNTILHQLSKDNSISSKFWMDLAYSKEVFTIRNNNGMTALALALESDNQTCLTVLTDITEGEFILDQDKHDGKTVLHKACEKNMYDEIQSFLEMGGKELLMKQDIRGNSALHLLPPCCKYHEKQFQCVQDMIKIGGKDLFASINNEGNKPPIILEINQYTQDSPQRLQMEIEQLKEQLVLEEKRGQNEIEIVKKWHEDRYKESMSVLEKKEKEIWRLEKVETSMKKDLDNQKDMIDKLQKVTHQLIEKSEKKEQENDVLREEIESLKQQIASSASISKHIVDKQSEEEIIVDDFEEVAMSSVTKEHFEVDKCNVQREKLEKELECSICFDPFEDPHIVPECCHRFCFKCIDTAIKKSGKECPMCRKRISSKRSLRRDELIGKISKLVFSDDKEGGENKDKLVTETAKAKSATEIQQHKEEFTSMKDKIDSQEEMLKQNASNISQLEKRIAEKDEANLSLKGVITAKENENNAFKQEINTLKLQISSSLNSKRSRDENQSSDNEADYSIPKKRSKPNGSVARYCTNEEAANLESENEDLLQQLKKEKANHMKTIERLENARKKLKAANHAH